LYLDIIKYLHQVSTYFIFFLNYRLLSPYCVFFFNFFWSISIQIRWFLPVDIICNIFLCLCILNFTLTNLNIMPEQNLNYLIQFVPFSNYYFNYSIYIIRINRVNYPLLLYIFFTPISHKNAIMTNTKTTYLITLVHILWS